MEIGKSRVVNMVMRFLDPEVRQDLENYVHQVVLENFIEFKTEEQIQTVFQSKVFQFLSHLSEDNLLNLRSYTGFHFRDINAVLRGNWTYEKNGRLTEKDRSRYFKVAEEISRMIEQAPIMDINFVAYRGVDIAAFSEYGISSLEQLKAMEGNYMYEKGFTSTSLLKESSFFDRKLENGTFCNIGIKYLISDECREGLFLDGDMTYSSKLNEYLINKNTLSKVVSVYIDEENNRAMLTVVVIPKSKWNVPVYGNEVKKGR